MNLGWLKGWNLCSLAMLTVLLSSQRNKFIPGLGLQCCRRCVVYKTEEQRAAQTCRAHRPCSAMADNTSSVPHIERPAASTALKTQCYLVTCHPHNCHAGMYLNCPEHFTQIRGHCAQHEGHQSYVFNLRTLHLEMVFKIIWRMAVHILPSCRH